MFVKKELILVVKSFGAGNQGPTSSAPLCGDLLIDGVAGVNVGDLGVSPRVNVSVNFLLGRLMQWGFEWPMVDLSGLCWI